MTKTIKDFKGQPLASAASGSKPVRQGGTTEAAKTVLTPEHASGTGTGGGLAGLSAAFLVGTALGLAAGADQQPAKGADVHLCLDDEPTGTDHQADYGCGL